MKEAHRANILHSILANYTICYLDNMKFIIQEPSRTLIYDSYDLYHQIIDRHKYDNMLIDDDVLLLLVNQQLWTIDGDKNFAEIDKSIDDIKYNMFKTFYRDHKTCQKLRQTLQKVRHKQSEMYRVRYQFEQYTLEGLAEYMRKHFIYLHTIYDSNHKKLWMDLSHYDGDLVDRIMLAHVKLQPTESEYRELARTNPWTGYWLAYKTTLIPSDNLRLEQLVAFSKFYDNIHKSPDCPDNDIINDDDLLDGWLIQQQKEKDEKRRENTTSQIGMRGKGDIFIPVRTQEDANQIYARNAPDVRARNKLRSKYINDKGEVKDLELPDVQREIAMDAQRLAGAHSKRSKG